MPETTEATMNDVMAFVNDDLMEKIGAVLNKANVNVSTVHFTLAAMIANDVAWHAVNDGDQKDLSVGLLSINHFMYQYAMSAYSQFRKEGAH